MENYRPVISDIEPLSWNFMPEDTLSCFACHVEPAGHKAVLTVGACAFRLCLCRGCLDDGPDAIWVKINVKPKKEVRGLRTSIHENTVMEQSVGAK